MKAVAKWISGAVISMLIGLASGSAYGQTAHNCDPGWKIKADGSCERDAAVQVPVDVGTHHAGQLTAEQKESIYQANHVQAEADEGQQDANCKWHVAYQAAHGNEDAERDRRLRMERFMKTAKKSKSATAQQRNSTEGYPSRFCGCVH